MILKGNARSGADNLARHLLNTRDNDRVEVADIQGVAALDLWGALRDMEAVATGTKCTAHLYSLSINPQTPMTREQYGAAIERIERELGLEGQPRAVVFHHKESAKTGESREHAHVVWSRIDAATMTAKQLSFDRMKLRTVARELAQELGHAIPKNIANDRGGERFADRFQKATLAEIGQQKRTGLDPATRKAEVTAAFRAADSGLAFINSLEERGYYIAQGERRGFVVVDRAGEVHSLSRQIEGAKAKEIAAKLSPLTSEQLPTVEAAKAFIAQRQRAQSDRSTAYAGALTEPTAHEHRHKELLQTQTAELKAVTAKFAALRADARAREAAAAELAIKAVKTDIRPQWRELLQRQTSERKELAEAGRNFAGRLSYFVKNADLVRFHPDGRGIVAHAFNWIVKGNGAAAVERLDHAHTRERRELAREQHRQTQAAARQVRKEFAPYYRELATDQRRDSQTLKAQHRLQALSSEKQTQQAHARSRGDDMPKPHYKVERERIEKSESFTVKFSDAQASGQSRAELKAAAKERFREAFRSRPDNERKL